MKNLITKLSNRSEFFLILFIGFGVFIYASNQFLFNSSSSTASSYRIYDFGIYSILIYELIAFPIIFYILKIRTWKTKDFNLDFKIKLIFVALLLIVIRNVLSNIGIKVLDSFSIINESTSSALNYNLEANWISLSLVIIINSIYEEFLLTGYLFKRLENYHPLLILSSSILIRESFHTYQGWVSVVSIIPTGLVFGIYYLKYKKLWTVILAHAIGNLLIFISLHFHWAEKIQSLRE